MSRLTLIAAATQSSGIGLKSDLPWRLRKEMAYFTRVTSEAPEGSHNAVIMGRKSWECIPDKYRPLPHRANVVITHNKSYTIKEEDLEKAPVLVQSNLATAAQDLASLLKGKAKYDKKLHKAFIIGGAGLYSAALRLTKESGAFADRVLLTRILSPEYECDVFMEDFTKDPAWTRASHEQLSEWVGFEVPRGIQEENGAKYEFQMWVRET